MIPFEALFSRVRYHKQLTSFIILCWDFIHQRTEEHCGRFISQPFLTYEGGIISQVVFEVQFDVIYSKSYRKALLNLILNGTYHVYQFDSRYLDIRGKLKVLLL